MKVEVNEQEMNKMDKEEFVEGVVRMRSCDLRMRWRNRCLKLWSERKKILFLKL